MLIIIISLFAIAILGGLYLLSYVINDKNTPKSIAFLHGSVAACALILLLLYVIFYFSSFALTSLILFIFAAMGGIVLIYRDLKGQLIPKWLAVGHGALGITAFIVLLISVF